MASDKIITGNTPQLLDTVKGNSITVGSATLKSSKLSDPVRKHQKKDCASKSIQHQSLGFSNVDAEGRISHCKQTQAISPNRKTHKTKKVVKALEAAANSTSQVTDKPIAQKTERDSVNHVDIKNTEEELISVASQNIN